MRKKKTVEPVPKGDLTFEHVCVTCNRNGNRSTTLGLAARPLSARLLRSSPPQSSKPHGPDPSSGRGFRYSR